ncbi:MAG: selenide, water dikinase SelD, partial [Alphaproteobacteria bacterium]|nr:selenide, water dikinase SelD [Alphaproteobacteria bacterium]
DPYRFGQIAANHALGDLYAMNATPHSALAIATVPQAAEGKVEETLYQLLAGAQAVLRQAGATLVGGHSAEAAELGLGLSVTGFARPERLWRKGGLRPGDRLILTRPLGTGVLFAGQMRRRARARWIEAAVAGMLQPAAPAAAVLRDHGVAACTDVTGFGLFGHAREMAVASAVALTLSIGRLPVLAGVRELLAEGIASTLAPANASATPAAATSAVAHDPLLPILFDPQTAGGLLAGLAADAAEDCLRALRSGACPDAAIIGEVIGSDSQGRVTVLP